MTTACNMMHASKAACAHTWGSVKVSVYVRCNQEGKPDIYISHGTKDAVLGIDYCSRRLVPRLQKQGYEVKYHEFDGPHTVPRDICQEGMQWFLGELAVSKS